MVLDFRTSADRLTTSNSEFEEKTKGSEVASVFADELKQRKILIAGVGPKQVGARLTQTLAAHGLNLLVLTGRFTDKVEAVTEFTREAHPNVHIRILKLYVASFESVCSTAAEVNAYTEQSIDILIKNAGAMNIPVLMVLRCISRPTTSGVSYSPTS
ncbi:hypothetical protein OCU04_009304 [Sclerotinia nivalis]|uniref:Uncharacterized protein n=1 Tax=Sclerotinia nivalis TaxID=352851 RepID=A0A9X0DFZ4_9HELO|nr:hypothetical protein OCU04_009304 [Sclerotinia nivalis]